MNLVSMLVILLQTSVVLAIALAACLATKSTPAIRLAVCRVTLLTLIGLLIWRPWNHANPEPVVPISFASAALSGPHEPTFAVRPGEDSKPAAKHFVEVTPVNGVASVTPSATSPKKLISGVWITVSGLFAINLLFGTLALWRLSRRSAQVEDPKILGIVETLAKQASVKTPRLMVCPETQGLFVSGVFRPTIFAPRSLLETLTNDGLSVILGHEIAHIANGDLLWGVVRRGVLAALWWQPLLWLIRHPMESAAEELCDRRVLATGIAHEQYADFLLTLREKVGSKNYPSLSIGAVSGRSSLGARIEAILDPSRPLATRVPRSVASAIASVGFLVAFGVPKVFARPVIDISPTVTLDFVTRPYAAAIRIVDSHGNPVKDGTAWLVLQTNRPEPTTRLAVRDGVVSVPFLKLPEFSSAKLVAEAPGLALGYARLWPAPKKVDQIVLGDPHTLTGTVLMPNHQPAVGVRIFATDVTRWFGQNDFLDNLDRFPFLGLNSVTDARGRFAIHGLPGMSAVQIEVGDDRWTSINWIPQIVQGDGPTSDSSILLAPASQISGVVTENGRPVAGIEVTVSGTNVGYADSRSDASGKFTISRLPAGTFTVAANATTQVTTSDHVGVQLKTGQSLANVNFNLVPGALIQGQVLLEDGTPLSQAPVGTYGPDAMLREVMTDANGLYEARVLPGEQYVYCQDRSGQEGAHLKVSEGSTTNVDIHVTARPDEIWPPGQSGPSWPREQTQPKGATR